MNIVEKLIEGLTFYIDAVEKVTHGYDTYYMNDFRKCVIGRHNPLEIKHWEQHQNTMLNLFLMRDMPKYDKNNKLIYYFNDESNADCQFLELEWEVIRLFTDYVCDEEQKETLDSGDIHISKTEWLEKAKNVLKELNSYLED